MSMLGIFCLMAKCQLQWEQISIIDKIIERMGQEELQKQSIVGQRQDRFDDELYFGKEKPIPVPQSMVGELPHTLIGAITFETKKGIPGLGTGVLISPDLILTAAHNLINGNQQLYKNFRFYPGQHGPLQKYLSCSSWYVPDAFKTKNCSTTDYALLKLERPAPLSVFMEMETVWEIKEGEKIAVFGYLGDEFNSKNPFDKYAMELHQSGLAGDPEIVDQFRKNKKDILYTLSTTKGQSGAPILLIRKDNPPAIIGIHKGGARVDDGGKEKLFNCGRHIDSELREELRKKAKEMGALPFESRENSEGYAQGEALLLQKMREEEEEPLPQRAPDQQPEHLLALCRKARALLEQRNFKEALKVSMQAVGVGQESAEAHSNLGWALWGEKQYEESIKSCRKALEIDPNFAIPYNYQGNSLSDLGRKEQAIECYKKALAIDPNYAYAHNGMGNALDDLGRKDQAIECFKKALAIDPNYAYAHNNMGISLSDLGRKEQAIECYKQALAIDPNYAYAHNNMGISLSDLGRKEQAVQCYFRAIELDPSYQQCLNNLLELLESGVLKKEGLQFLRRVQSVYPSCKPVKEAIRHLEKK